MKILPVQAIPSSRRRRTALTLVELVVGMGIFLGIFVGALISLQIFGLRVYTLAATKLTSTAEARITLNALRSQIRSSKIVYVGSYTNGVFNRIPDGQPQTGNALEIYFATTNSMPSDTPVIYYQRSTPSQDALFSTSNGVVRLLANSVTNHYVFTAENYLTHTMRNYDNNPVIRVTLQFHQWEYPLAGIGTNGLNAYNFYRLQTRISRRTKE